MDARQVSAKKSRKQSSASGKREKKEIKVVYISTPMKVQTSASKFRETVQELTGKDSDITRYTDGNSTYASGDVSGYGFEEFSSFENGYGSYGMSQNYNTSHQYYNSSSSSYYDSSLSSESSGYDDVAALPVMDESFMGWLDSNLLSNEEATWGA